jgi:phosphate starvation-inducible PhoH-like protein
LPRTQLSGLVDAERVLKRVKGIAITRLTSADVVRHPLVARIVDAYDKTLPAEPRLVDSEDATEVIATPARKTRARSRNGA